MDNNVTPEDISALRSFLDTPDVRLTNGSQVRAFEEEFAAWLGVRYAVMVNSGSSANLITMQALKILHGVERVLVPCITWVSDIAAVLHAGMEPVFVDVDPETLGMDWTTAQRKASSMDIAVFPTHCLGFNAMVGPLPCFRDDGKHYQPWVVEDCCESLGGTSVAGSRHGTRGLMSNFSFYYAHHMTTIEGGMVCTDDAECYQTLRRLRSHGLVREMDDPERRAAWSANNPSLDPEFIFTHPAYNVRPTEINAVLGRSQLMRLDENNDRRTRNLKAFLSMLHPSRYRTRYRTEGSCNYALPLILNAPDDDLFKRVLSTLREQGIECRRGTAGGGNQLRQPYAIHRWGELYKEFPEAEYIHRYGLYVGNYPTLELEKIERLCEALWRL
jgi:CDP-6-deoxy-D-xylo-4-hexulose-3-dehydrase